MEKVELTEESELLIDFAKELIKEYNESLTRELKNFRYKVNYNDSYERLVYKVNGKKMKRYTARLKNSLRIDLLKEVENKNLSEQQIDGLVFKRISDILKTINIQPEIIHDVIINMTKEDKKCRSKYDLNIYDIDHLTFTENCFDVDYIKLSKPIEEYVNGSDNHRRRSIKSFIILEKLCNTMYTEERPKVKRK